MGWWPDLAVERKVELLETLDLGERLTLVLGWVKDALAEHELAEKIRNDVSEGLEGRQREFLLRQQMDAIRKELGEDGDDDSIGGYRERLTALVEAGAVPEATRKAIEREIDRFERTPSRTSSTAGSATGSTPCSRSRGASAAWTTTTSPRPARCSTPTTPASRRSRTASSRCWPSASCWPSGPPPGRVREEHDQDAAGPVDRTRPATSPTIRPPARRHRGPRRSPGVGKTSLGASVARALGRKFTRIALGGIRDEAEIRGHRRTYVGAQAGRIVRALTEAGTMNPVILLDEVDKIGADWRGDPSSALLEVLDPAQNHTFRDHYLEVDLDLSDVLFLATANMLETIPGPLLDRMEVIRLDGYTHDEKVAIARDHLFARQQARNGLRDGEVEVTDAALGEIVDGYTREAGVRNLERELGKLLRKAATAVAQGPRHRSWSTPATCPAYLKRRRFHDEAADRTSVPGVATGLAVTGVGGDVLFVEATSMPGESGHDRHRPARRRDEGVGADRPVLRPLPGRPCSASTRRRWTASGSTCTSPPAPSPRTAPRPASP